jgi:hypothetical protein
MAVVVILSILLGALGVVTALRAGATGGWPGRAAEATPDRQAALLEILPVAVSAGSIRSLRPRDAASWQVACPPGADPGPVVVEALRTRGLRPSVVHSTSWRHQDGRLVLTYLAVLATGERAAGDLVSLPVRPGPLARGGATTPPASLDVDQVIHHALRHLAWLQREVPAVAAELDVIWVAALAGHRPAPFHALPTEPRAAGPALTAAPAALAAGAVLPA